MAAFQLEHRPALPGISMNKGYLNLVLHAHLPFVHHPEAHGLLEERWLFEAITDCYLPLIRVFDRLQAAGTPFRLVLSLSPTLIAMLQSELLRQRYLDHLQRMQALADSEMERTRRQAPELHHLACLYQRLLADNRYLYEVRYQTDLLGAFRQHQEAGCLELITSAATHGFLPLLSHHDSSVRAQIFTGVEAFEQAFGMHPEGIWLPECGYYPGLERILKEAGLRYFFADSHAILHASEPPRFGLHAPIDCGNGIAAFGRDPDCSRQVWSATEGYPGDVDYREYHSDAGFELELDYIRPYILDGDVRASTGIKYYRVTGTPEKAPYDPIAAARKAARHAVEFVTERRHQIEQLNATLQHPPMVVAPYDAELFGHWWFEGPLWLESVIRLTAARDNTFELVGCGDYLQKIRSQPMQVAVPSESSWGEQGYHRFWLNEHNHWIYPRLHEAAQQMEQLTDSCRRARPGSLIDRALKQAARSLLLAQASDWPFIMRSGTTVEYAVQRVTDHLARFSYLYDCITKDRIDHYHLGALEIMDNIFPEIDCRHFRNINTRETMEHP